MGGVGRGSHLLVMTDIPANSRPTVDPVAYLRDYWKIPVVWLSQSRMRGHAGMSVLYEDGTREVRLSKCLPLGTMAGEMNIWHEIGHIIDQARFLIPSRNTNMHHGAVTGRYSRRFHAELDANAEAIIGGRPMNVVIAHGGREWSVLDFEQAEGIDPALRAHLLGRAREGMRQQRRYLRQGIELFAEGFALFMVQRTLLAEKAPDLLEVFSTAAAECGLDC